jgi:RNA polymerase sigma-70 factor, ECF subfamily
VITDDLSLVRRAQEGDSRAFGLLIERYQRKVYAVAFGMLKDPEDARDISQEAFVKVYKYLDHFKGEASFYTWVYRITANLCIDAVRKRGPSRGENVEFDESIALDTSEANLGSLGNFETNPQKLSLRKELAEKLQEALQQLPEKHRAILLMREVEGMSYEDLAESLEIPKGTVMSRLFHARAKVQKILSEYLDLKSPNKGD